MFSNLGRSSDEATKPLLGVNQVFCTNFYILAFCLISLTFLLTISNSNSLLTGSKCNTSSSWRVNYATISLILQFTFHLSLAAVSAYNKQLPAGSIIILVINFINIAYNVVLTFRNVSAGTVMLPNDALSVATMLIFAGLLVFAFTGKARSIGSNDQHGDNAA